MAKMEDDIVEKYQPKFYKCYVDGIINCPKKTSRSSRSSRSFVQWFS